MTRPTTAAPPRRWSATPSLAAGALAAAPTARAGTPRQAGAQAPGGCRMQLGDFEATARCDGRIRKEGSGYGWVPVEHGPR